MASSKKQEQSEGPFLVLSESNLGSNGLKGADDYQPVNYVTYFRTRAALEKYIKDNNASRNIFNIFDGLARVSYSHEAVYGDFSDVK